MKRQDNFYELIDFPKRPFTPHFQFQPKLDKLNWEQIGNAQIDKIRSKVDVNKLSKFLMNITQAQLNKDDFEGVCVSNNA